MNKKIPRPPVNISDAPAQAQEAAGFGSRSMWPLAPVGEAARRDPHIPDPVPNSGAPRGQEDASPPVHNVRGFGVGDGGTYNGLYSTIIYVKKLGNTIQRALARNYLSGVVETRWRVGGVSLPQSSGVPGNWGMGYHGDASSLWPDNPQNYLRNPGIRPLAGVPQTYRYTTMGGIQDVGPSIADFGNPPASGTP